jgi:hypothetical protein
LDTFFCDSRGSRANSARDESHDLHLFLREAAHLVGGDEIVRVAVMAAAGNVEADVVQERGVFQE